MKSILYKTPSEFYELWKNGLIKTEKINGKAKHFFRDRMSENQTSSSSESFNRQNKVIEQKNRNLTHSLI